ncbi:MAG: hypothetical protein M1834_008564 [Cirrosporium novae-zelandiae]|nr:MAG: hypothetical protein M1834_008564 [Cirrosporium novae-zelandiae]
MTPLQPHEDEDSLFMLDELEHALLELTAHPYPHVPNPPNYPKRASVALIIRIRPTSQQLCQQLEEDVLQSTADNLRAFFAQPWIKRGTPEILFIRRATRTGDRWTGHVALPGGKRDPEDRDDAAVAVRETWEEIGLDLKSSSVLHAGNLPERVVATSWGKRPLMVLCPFVYLLADPRGPLLQLQATEVESVHWVPLQALLSPSSRTYEYCDVSNRLSRQGGPIIRTFLRAMLGQMMFAAIQLVPTESFYSSPIASISPYLQTTLESQSLVSMVRSWLFLARWRNPKPEKPLLLWGLTHGIVLDFFQQLPSQEAIDFWSYPTFTAFDVRWIIHLMTHSFRQEKAQVITENMAIRRSSVDYGNDKDNNISIEVLNSPGLGTSIRPLSAVDIMLDGYYDLITQGTLVALMARLATSILLGYIVIRGRSSFKDFGGSLIEYGMTTLTRLKSVVGNIY